MVKVLNRDKVNRMVSRKGNVYGVSGGGGGSDIDLSGYATTIWTQQNFVSIEYFRKLFRAFDANNNEIVPNNTSSLVSNIKATVGFWTEQYLSALGQGSGGGGGGGASSLSELLDVALNQPSDGQSLVYDASISKWVNRTVGGTDMSSVWSALSVGTSEQINVSHLTNALSGYVTTSAISDMATQTWVGQQGYATQTWVGQQGYATQTWVSQNFITISFFDRLFQAYEGTGSSATRVNPNDTTSTIDNIKAMFGFWTEQYLSTLGQGSGGGGGGGASSLSELLDVALNQPSDGQSLVYDASISKWVNRTVGGTDMSSVWSALSVGTSEQINVSHLTNALSGYATQTWVGQQGYATQTWVGQQGYATQTWVSQQGYATQTWVSQNFITISFFDRLFQAYEGTGSSATRVNPNDTTSTIDNIKAMFGFWTEQYLSALGQNSGGGGGIVLSEPLQSINSAGLGTPTASGVGLVWNGTSWTYGAIGGGSGTVTQIKVGDTPYSPVNGVVSLPAYPSVPTKTSQLTNDSGFITSSASITGNAATATTLATARTIWGQSFNGSGNVNGKIVLSSSTGSSANYDEGIRINAVFTNPLIHFGGSGNDGTGDNQWSIGLHDNKTFWALTYNSWSNYIITSNTSGNVGISTPTPETKLDINGIQQIYQRGLDNTAFKNLLLLKAQNNTEADGDAWSDTYPTFGIGFRRYWSSNGEPYGETTCAGIYATISAAWRGGLVFRTKNNQTQGGTHDVTALRLAPSGAATFVSTVTATTFVGSLSGNAATATKLATSRTLWGQSFDGSGNVSGNMTGVGSITASGTIKSTFYGPAFAAHTATSQWSYMSYKSGDYEWHIGTTDSTSAYIGQAGAFEIRSVGDSYSGISIRRGTSSYGRLVVTSTTPECSIGLRRSNTTGNPQWVFGIISTSDRFGFWNTANAKFVANFSPNGSLYLGDGDTAASYKLHVAGTFYASGNSSIGGTLGVTGKATVGGDLTVNGGDLTVNEPVSSGAAAIWFQSGGTTYGNLRVKPDNGEFYFYQGETNGGQSSVCVNAGGFYAYGQVTALSDERDKNVMGDVSLNIEQIANAPAIRFMWNDGRDDKSMQAGSIAQYWHKVLPEVIREKDDRLSLSYGVAALVSSIITARKVVDHERRIAELEKENKKLKMKLKIA